MIERALNTRIIQDRGDPVILIENLSLVEYLRIVRDIYGSDIQITSYANAKNDVLVNSAQLKPVEIATETTVRSIDRVLGRVGATSPTYYAHGGSAFVLTENRGLTLARLYIQTTYVVNELFRDFDEIGWKDRNLEPERGGQRKYYKGVKAV